MNEIILLKLGEVVLKGMNRRTFENRLTSNIRRRLKPYGNFEVYNLQSAIYVEPQSKACDMDGAFEAMGRVFGVVSLTRAFACKKNTDAIFETAAACLGERLETVKSFKVESKRADKSFPMTSIALSQEVGGRLHDRFSPIEVDVRNPELTVHLEVRDRAAYVHAPPVPGAGGLPQGMGGRGLLLLSGGIDSPVAGWMMAKRGMEIECAHFFSYPYTSELARDKVIRLAEILCRYCGRMTVNIVPFTEIQEQIRDNCAEELGTVLTRRFMMRAAQAIAKNDGCEALITGESLGQVASQTLQAMAVTGQVCELPVFRPVIGLDKEEIVGFARRIGTFETSVLPYEDCCTVFTPRHPKTKPDLEKTIAEENRLDIGALVNKAVENIEKVVVKL